MRWTFWFLLFLLCSAVYFSYRWYIRQQAQPFELELVALDTARIDWFSMLQAGEKDEWVFKREGDHWLLSNGFATARANQEKVEQLLAACSRFVSDSILLPSVTGLHLDPNRAFQFRFYEGQQQLSAFTLWPPDKTETYARAYLQKRPGTEIFLIHEGKRSACWTPLEKYLDKNILPFSWKEVNYVAISDTTGLKLQAFRRDSLWVDTLGNNITYKGLYPLQATTATDNFRFRTGQIPLAEKQWSLLLGTGAIESPKALPDSLAHLPKGYVQIDVFYDSTATPPYFYTSSLYPGECFRSDSSDALLQLLLPLATPISPHGPGKNRRQKLLPD